MIKQYLFALSLTYIEYFFLLFCLKYPHSITWDCIKFWLKYPPFICLFFFLIDNWVFVTLIYTTFTYPYMLMLYCIRSVNRKSFGNNKLIINYKSFIKNDS